MISICSGDVVVTRRAFVAGISVSMFASSCVRGTVPAAVTRVTVPENFFGLHVNNAVPNGLWNEGETPLPAIKAKAIRLWNSGTTWRCINPARGVFDFSRLDYRIKSARSAGFEVMLTLGQPPNWAAPSLGASYEVNPNPPYRLEDWNNYIETVARRYRDEVKYYEVWNEPDLDEGFRGSIESLLELSKSVYRIVKRLSPLSKVMTPAFCMPSFGRFVSKINLEHWIQIGGHKFCDAISIHAYAGDGLQPERVLDGLDVVKRLLQKNDVAHLPVYDTESGARGWRDASRAIHNIPETGFDEPLPIHPIDFQSAWTTRQLLCVAMSGLKQAYYFTFDNGNGLGATKSVMAIQMTDYPRQPALLRPPALAYRYLAGLLPGSTLERFSRDGDCFRVALTQRNGRMATIYWTSDFREAEIPIDVKAVVCDNLGRSVKAGTLLRIGPSPLFVFDS